MNEKKHRISPRGGMTLIEVVAAMAIIAVCAAMLLTAYSATLNVMRHSTESARRSDAAFAAAESDGAEEQRGELSFWADGSKYTVSGTYRYGGERFYRFTPDRGAK